MEPATERIFQHCRSSRRRIRYRGFPLCPPGPLARCERGREGARLLPSDYLRTTKKADYETRGAAVTAGGAACDGAGVTGDGAGAIGYAAGVTGCVVEGTDAAGVTTGCVGLGAGAVGEEVAGAVGVTVPLIFAFSFGPMV